MDFSVENCERDPSKEPGWYMCYTRCNVGNTTCATVVDPCCLQNFASQTLVDAFRLTTTPHPQPYKMKWLGSYVQITHQVKVKFTITGCSDSAVFDVMPIHMKVCSLVIGKPWTAMHNWQRVFLCPTVRFSFLMKGKQYFVHAYTSQQYFVDRHKRDQALIAANEKKKHATCAEILVCPQKSDISHEKAEGTEILACINQEDLKISGAISDEVDAPKCGLNMLLKKAQEVDEVSVEKGQRWNVFQSQCKIRDKPCKVIIDGGSYTNAISKELVQSLGLSTWRHSQPHHVKWLYNSGRLKITHKVRVSFSIGDYVDKVICDVVPMDACQLLLGRPWQYDNDATHSGRSNSYSFVHHGKRHVLKPMVESAIHDDELTSVPKFPQKPVALEGQHTEVLCGLMHHEVDNLQHKELLTQPNITAGTSRGRLVLKEGRMMRIEGPVSVCQYSDVMRTSTKDSKSSKHDIWKVHQVCIPTDQTVRDLEVPTKSYAGFIDRITSCPARHARDSYKKSLWVARQVKNVSRSSRTFQGRGIYAFSSSNRIQANPITKRKDRKDLIRFGFAFRPP